MSQVHDSNDRKRTFGLAIASLVLSCLSIILGPFGCLPGIVCGHLARRGIRKSGGRGGEGIALAGLIIGYVFLILLILIVTVFWGLEARSK
jgi:hypothetical protein